LICRKGEVESPPYKVPGTISHKTLSKLNENDRAGKGKVIFWEKEK